MSKPIAPETQVHSVAGVVQKVTFLGNTDNVNFERFAHG